MKIKMLIDSNGCDVNDKGINLGVKIYLKDEVYSVGDSLKKTFLDLGCCVLYVEKESKNLGPAPENKMIKKDVENKTIVKPVKKVKRRKVKAK